MNEKEFFEITNEQFEDEFVVKDISKLDHWLLVGIGVLPFVIASIWHYVTF